MSYNTLHRDVIIKINIYYVYGGMVSVFASSVVDRGVGANQRLKLVFVASLLSMQL